MHCSRTSVSCAWLVCLCALSSGCITQQTKTDGTFVSGGSGTYGTPAGDAAVAAKPKARKAQSYEPSSKLKLASAAFLEQRGARDEARQRYEELLAIDSKSTDAVLGLARLDQVAGRTAEAEAGFQRAVRMENASGRTLDSLGQFYVDQKRWTEAMATLQKATAAAPNEKGYRFHYAIALAKAGQINEAIPHLRSTVDPAAVHYNIGLILHERGDLNGAEEQFSQALIQNPRLQPAQQWLTDVRRERELEVANANRRQQATNVGNWEQADLQR
ncbi:MAG: tetratricopeptide repeat protein [Planctomycetia bacterium]|nr:tetratricopeptide repeat protein [Planctomycetia bacterium]